VASATLMPAARTDGSALSPDGKWMAFESTQRGPKQIVLREMVTGKQQLLTGGNCNNSSPAWEEDSQTLIFASDCGRGTGMPVLYRASLFSQTHINLGFGVFNATNFSGATTVAQAQH
jgi:Tol biopolymer transport system component